MHCNQHPDKKAIAICVGCSRPLCDDCRVIFEGKNICLECEQKLQSVVNENSNNDNIDEFISEITNRAKKLLKDEGIDEEITKLINNTNGKLSGFLNTFEKQYKNYYIK